MLSFGCRILSSEGLNTSLIFSFLFLSCIYFKNKPVLKMINLTDFSSWSAQMKSPPISVRIGNNLGWCNSRELTRHCLVFHTFSSSHAAPPPPPLCSFCTHLISCDFLHHPFFGCIIPLMYYPFWRVISMENEPESSCSSCIIVASFTFFVHVTVLWSRYRISS